MTRKHSDTTIRNVQLVKALIDENPLNRKSITELIKGIHVGRNQLQEAFKDVTGRTMKQYRRDKRIEAAAELLTTGSLKINEVAKKCGYRKSTNNFSRDFKVVFGLTPEEWLQNPSSKQLTVTNNVNFKKNEVQ